jgi:serine/threonine protein kinase
LRGEAKDLSSSAAMLRQPTYYLSPRRTLMEITQSPDQVRARLNDDLANGKTIVLSTQELDNPSLREQLPQLLEDLSRAHSPSNAHGPRIPGYTMLGEIGQGGMSTVYLARQDNLGRHIAIKVAPKWLGGGERARRMLVQEAHAMARLSHPNIVVIHDIIDANDTFAIAMEWVDGRTLASLLRSLPEQPNEDDMALIRASLGTPADEHDNFEDTCQRHFVRLMHDIARATQAVHDNALLHLDIKPSNVLVRRDGTPLLADFGVTRDTSDESNQTRTFAGTPVYAAPEQLRRDDKNIGPRTDVYSLGITLYEALARSQPLQGKNLPAILQCIENGAMPRLSQKVAVPPDLENIVHKAIAPEPEHRYQSATEFADDLAAFLEHRPVIARPLSRMQRLRRWMRNEPWKAGLAATLLIALPLLGGLGSYLVAQWPTLVVADENESFARASDLKQEAYLRWFINKIPTSQAIQSLEQAILLDPGESSVACLLALSNEEGWQQATDAIAKHSNQGRATLGTQLFAKKVSERRSFFTPAESSRLLTSDVVADRYLAALDQVFRANDDRLETSAELAVRYLEEVLLAAPDDPLLHGLVAWFSIRAEHPERYEASFRTMWQRWPNNPIALAWAPLSIEQSDLGRAKELARMIIERMPTKPHGYELLTGAETRTNNLEVAKQIIQEAAQAKVSPPLPEHLILRVQAAQGDQDAVRRRIEIARSSGNLLMEVHTLRFATKATMKARIGEIAEIADAPPKVYEAAYYFSREDRSLSDRVWARYSSLYPDRQRMLQSRFDRIFFDASKITISNNEDMKVAAALAAKITANKRGIDDFAARAGRALMYVRDWANLMRTSTRWQQFGSKPSEAAFFKAVGLSRIGEYTHAAESLSVALTFTAQKKAWYCEALLEDAWLRCSPEAPASLHDLGLATARIAKFQELNPKLKAPHEGPWTELIIGEVMLANGDRAGALEAFHRGLRRGLKREVLAPANYRALLESAKQRAEAK